MKTIDNLTTISLSSSTPTKTNRFYKKKFIKTKTFDQMSKNHYHKKCKNLNR